MSFVIGTIFEIRGYFGTKQPVFRDIDRLIKLSVYLSTTRSYLSRTSFNTYIQDPSWINNFRYCIIFLNYLDTILHELERIWKNNDGRKWHRQGILFSKIPQIPRSRKIAGLKTSSTPSPILPLLLINYRAQLFLKPEEQRTERKCEKFSFIASENSFVLETSSTRTFRLSPLIQRRQLSREYSHVDSPRRGKEGWSTSEPVPTGISGKTASIRGGGAQLALEQA